MNSTVDLSLLDQWRKRFGGKRRRRDQPWPQAALGYITDGPVVDGLVEIEKLTFVLLFDEPIPGGPCALRLAGYACHRVPWGVRIGGDGHCKFRKDLFLQPVPDGSGYRLDQADGELIELGLELDRQLYRHARVGRPLHARPWLPAFWAGFPPEVAGKITGDGPELQADAARRGVEPQVLFERLRRNHQGMILFPLPWVSRYWRQVAAIFADMEKFPKRQVFRHTQREDLTGFFRAVEFDFLGRPSATRRPVWRRRRTAAVA
jgi:hypothetical protein